MFKFGLKIWSINKDYVSDAIRLYKKNVYDYVELFAVPGSFKDCLELWKDLNIPYVIHAAHSLTGLNLAKKECWEKNYELAKEAISFADELGAKIIIFHPGINGDIRETVNQLNKINDHRIVIENKPYYGIYEGIICNGSLPEEIDFILKNTNVGFCLDVGHAIYAANAYNLNYIDYLKKFVKLNPKICHISDGDKDSVYDQHKNIGDGEFDFKEIFKILPSNIFMSIETEKKFKNILTDFEKDALLLREILKRRKNYAKN